MNSTNNESLFPIVACSLQDRVYTSTYLFFKLLNATYLRLLIGPGILLNSLCLFILSRPRLSNKSTTIIFLRVLALFDILSISLKYIRAEINYQSIEKGHEIFLLIPAVCKALYVSMNACISITMWTIVLMSLDKAIAVSYPLKSSIWLTHKRAFHICCLAIVILFLANLSFINLSDIHLARNHRKYCGLSDISFIVDLLTASILPMGLITAANIVIAVVLHRTSYDWRVSEDFSKRESNTSFSKRTLSSTSFRQRCSGASTNTGADTILATKRRINAQVTRMLLAVTLSLIIFNIPNTMFFVFVKIYDTRQLLFGRLCIDVSDRDIQLYKFGFYSSVTQDILSDLPHVVNFFLYCLAGKKFRSIFINEFNQLLVDLHLMKKRKERLSTIRTSGLNADVVGSIGHNINPGRSSPKTPPSKIRQSVEVLFNGKNALTTLNRQSTHLSRKRTYGSSDTGKCIRSNTMHQ
ncbi:unnamed protein product [Rotaria sordida]|uniref:G-protein coupled receptors family 1 profile domain-containing protein n=1 Tax=Rotaria sordida TaxID=392033 RepID=A0A818J1E9_9BILA|nr:unnamed protein product [Rotaria sordida]CAF3533661.1 unnamed protein product [Rotaria sordida]